MTPGRGTAATVDDGRGGTYGSWTRWRRPLYAVGAVGLALGQWHRVSSGKPFVVATGIGVACFWVSLLFLVAPPTGADRADPDVWRRRARRSVQVFGAWTIVAWSWLGAAAWWHSVKPVNLLVPAIPTLLTLAQAWTYRNADRFADVHGQERDR